MHAASVTAKNGRLLLRYVQYHVAKIVARTICPKADTKNSNQKKPKTFTAIKKKTSKFDYYFVSGNFYHANKASIVDYPFR